MYIYMCVYHIMICDHIMSVSRWLMISSNCFFSIDFEFTSFKELYILYDYSVDMIGIEIRIYKMEFRNDQWMIQTCVMIVIFSSNIGLILKIHHMLYDQISYCEFQNCKYTNNKSNNIRRAELSMIFHRTCCRDLDRIRIIRKFELKMHSEHEVWMSQFWELS